MITVSKIKLRFFKFKLKNMYKKYIACRDQYSCGTDLFYNIRPDMKELNDEMEKLYSKCLALEEVVKEDC